MTYPSAKIIADSISVNDHRITTMEVTLHRFVLAELNTHRQFSRNSASSRAIPTRKMLERVLASPAIPLVWSSEQPGMSGGAPIDDHHAHEASSIWQGASELMASCATQLQAIGVHKSITNRLLEPFMWHTVIITSTEWDNFFAQRCHPDAQPELRTVAEAMRDALCESSPIQLELKQWHLPYLQSDEYHLNMLDKIRLCVARCARVSYLTHDGIRDHEKDFQLYHRLLGQNPPHASPFEHAAMCMDSDEQYANFTGWMSRRFLLNI